MALISAQQWPFARFPPWAFEELKVNIGLLEGKWMDKLRVNRYIADHYNQGTIIYTDASNGTDKRVGMAHVVPELELNVAIWLNNDQAVYTAELVAIWFALLWVEGNERNGQSVIASVSSSALISIQNFYSGSGDILFEVLQLASRLQKADFIFYWSGRQALQKSNKQRIYRWNTVKPRLRESLKKTGLLKRVQAIDKRLFLFHTPV